MEMMRISPAQMEAFRRQAISDFEMRATQHLRQSLEELTRNESDEQLVVRIRHSLTLARKHGMSSEMQVMAYVDTSYYIGESFEMDPKHEWSRQVMESTVSPDEKAIILVWTARQYYQQQG